MSEPIRLLLVDDDDTFRQVLGRELGLRGYAVTTFATGRSVLEAAGAAAPDVVLLDLRLPDADGLEVLRGLRERVPEAEVVMLTGHGTIDTAIEAIRLGAFDYVAKPCPLDELEVRLHKAIERRDLVRRASVLESAFAPPDPAAGFVGRSAAHRDVVEMIARVAPTESTVLILGETGTGKDVAARMIHARSSRRDRPFVVVDCAGLQEELLRSELFGHEKGAFTGAVRRKHGLFEVADGGTVFLDEIGELGPGIQARLLRVLESSTFRRLGGTGEIRVDVRLLGATNRDLEARAREGSFRDDLLYRLQAIRLEMPPLRERRDDIAVLAEHFLAGDAARRDRPRRLSAAALRLLEDYDWPGNVRQLAHVLEHAALLADGDTIEPEHLPAALRSPRTAPQLPPGWPLVPLDDLERAHIERVLRETGGHRGRAAEILGISERNLYRRLRQYRLG